MPRWRRARQRQRRAALVARCARWQAPPEVAPWRRGAPCLQTHRTCTPRPRRWRPLLPEDGTTLLRVQRWQPEAPTTLQSRSTARAPRRVPGEGERRTRTRWVGTGRSSGLGSAHSRARRRPGPHRERDAPESAMPRIGWPLRHRRADEGERQRRRRRALQGRHSPGPPPRRWTQRERSARACGPASDAGIPKRPRQQWPLRHSANAGVGPRIHRSRPHADMLGRKALSLLAM